MPNDLLDLSIEQVNAVVAGYNERELDAECKCVMTGYYAGYYMGSKKPKKPVELIKRLINAQKKSTCNHDSLDSQNVEFFMQMESKRARFKLEEMMKSAE